MKNLHDLLLLQDTPTWKLDRLLIIMCAGDETHWSTMRLVRCGWATETFTKCIASEGLSVFKSCYKINTVESKTGAPCSVR